MKQNNSTELLGSSFPNIYEENDPKITKHAIGAIIWVINNHRKCEE